MKRLSRRQVLGGGVATAAALTLGAPAIHAQKGRRILRFVAQADLKILDPIWTTAYITRNHGYLVYDTLFGTDEQLQIRPQMVERSTVSANGMKYTFTLRDGLRWHHRLGTRDRSGEAQAACRGDPKGRPRRGDVRAVGRVVPADGLSQGGPGYSQVHRAGLLEREDHVGPIAEILRPLATAHSGEMDRQHPRAEWFPKST